MLLLGENDPVFQIFKQIRWIVRIVRSPLSVPTLSKCPLAEILRSAQHNIINNSFIFLLDCLKYLGVSNVENNWFWEAWSRPPGPKTIQIRGFELLSLFFLNGTPDTPRPQIQIFPEFPRFCIGIRLFFGLIGSKILYRDRKAAKGVRAKSGELVRGSDPPHLNMFCQPLVSLLIAY